MMYLVGKFKRSSRTIWRMLPFLISVFSLFTAMSCQSNKTQSTASKQVTKFKIKAPQLGTEKQIWVYLPKSYAKSQKRYPVVYMHDAQNLFDIHTSYAGEWEVDEYLDAIKKPESIIVGIEHGNEKRIEELTPYKNDKYGGGNGNNYLLFIKNTLKPQIDLKYRTLPNANNTGLMGSSLGGLISFYGVLKYPETFGLAGVFSPSFWINPDIFSLVEQTTIDPKLKWYFISGSQEGNEMLDYHHQMVALLSHKIENPANIHSKIVEGGQHNEEFWKSQFGEVYQWLLNEHHYSLNSQLE